MARSKLNVDQLEECLKGRLESQGREAVTSQMEQLRVAVFVMCGGGFLGSSAARQPASFYIDARCGRRPYSNTQVRQAVTTLAAYAKVLGLNPNDLGATNPVTFHNCGVF